MEIHEVTVFHELGKALTSSLQLDQVLRTIMEKINEVLRPDTWSLLLMDMEKHELYFQIATGAGAEALKDVRIKLGQGVAGWVAQSGEAVVVPDTSKDSRFFCARRRKNANSDAFDCRRAGALPRAMPGRNRADQLHRARRASAIAIWCCLRRWRTMPRSPSRMRGTCSASTS